MRLHFCVRDLHRCNPHLLAQSINLRLAIPPSLNSASELDNVLEDWGSNLLIGLFLAAALDDVSFTSAPLPLTSVGVVSDEDAPLDPEDPGTGGGLEVQTYFKTVVRSPDQIRRCFEQIEAAGATWASNHSLSRPVRILDEDRLLLQYTKSGIGGLFELRYRITTTPSPRARATLFFLATMVACRTQL